MAVNYHQINDDTMQPLLPAITSAGAPSSSHTHSRLPWHRLLQVWPKSRSVLLVLLWNVIVGVMYGAVIDTIVAGVLKTVKISSMGVMYSIFGGHAAVAFVQVLSYPVGGLMADLYCGRFRTIFFGLLKIVVGTLLLCVIGILYAINHYELGKNKVVQHFVLSAGGVVILLFLAGLTGFQVNAVQFGLDQMPDASSEELSVFLHWFVWTQSLGELIMRLYGSTLPCNKTMGTTALWFMPLPFLVITASLWVFSCYKRGWFHREPCTQNPYGTVYRVLKFAATHNRPLRRSAFTYSDDEMPSRVEYAKQRFGGPFSTETVEDVKTFLRIVLMLFLITPVFNLELATSFVFPLYGVHLGTEYIDRNTGCTPEWMLLQTGNLSFIISVVCIPLYLLFVHPHVPRFIPKILHRLVLGLALIVVNTALMFGILTIAKYQAIHRREEPEYNDTQISCMFVAELRPNITNSLLSQPLGFELPVLILPNLLMGIAQSLTYITILEFISAQSPHAMKGLLLGVFYACRGVFVMLGSLATFFFIPKNWWDTESAKGSVFDCGFSYYLTHVLLGVVELVVVCVGVRHYHYRKRQERPYDPSYVEDYYHRYVGVATRAGTRVRGGIEDSPQRHGHIDTSILRYGTMEGT